VLPDGLIWLSVAIVATFSKLHRVVLVQAQDQNEYAFESAEVAAKYHTVLAVHLQSSYGSGRVAVAVKTCNA